MTAATSPGRSGAGRTIVGVLLLALAGLAVAGAVAAAWTRSQLRDEDTWAATSQALVEDPAVREDVSRAIAVQVVSAAGVEDRLRGVLPGPLGRLADPITGGATDVIDQVTLQIVGTQAFADVWEAAVRASHQELLAALDGNGRFTRVDSGGISLDLAASLGQIQQALDDRGFDWLNGIDLSGIDVQVQLIDAPGLDRLRSFLDLLDIAVIALPVVAFIATGVGLVVARDRGLALVGGGVGLAIGAGLVAGASSVGRSEGIRRLDGGILGAAASRAVVDQVTSSLDPVLIVVALSGLAVAAVGIVISVVTHRPSR